jgi:hypothetical protein
LHLEVDVFVCVLTDVLVIHVFLLTKIWAFADEVGWLHFDRIHDNKQLLEKSSKVISILDTVHSNNDSARPPEAQRKNCTPDYELSNLEDQQKVDGEEAHTIHHKFENLVLSLLDLFGFFFFDSIFNY